MTDIPLYFQPTEPSSGVSLVAVDGECEGGAQAELACHLWLNTVLIPGELATPDYNRAWRLGTVLPPPKRAPQAGDRGTFLTIYEVETQRRRTATGRAKQAHRGGGPGRPCSLWPDCERHEGAFGDRIQGRDRCDDPGQYTSGTIRQQGDAAGSRAATN